MKKSLIGVIVVVIVIVVGTGIYYFTKGNEKQSTTTTQSPTVDNSNQINNKQTKMNTPLNKPDLATNFVGFLDTLQKNLGDKNFVLKVNKHYAPDFDADGYVKLMANVFDIGLKKMPFPNKMVCDVSDQSCTARFSITGSQLTQKYQRESDGMWYQVDAPEPLF
ncbi:MAG: hypothetical protein NT155_00135 [Candidatus Staskawiczbacteria bacterium]|nr:hypothetical protein [Candidatus Staskawiczbacteria bacterium]